MTEILIKILATALALSQVTARPEAVKTHFDPVKDQAEVVELLRAGCAHIRQAFDIEQLNLDDLISTAMDDPQALTGGDIKVFRGINFNDLYTTYKQFCRNETVANSPIDLGQVIPFYNQTLANLPQVSELKQLKLPGTSLILDQKGGRFTEVFRPGHRRVWTPLGQIPEIVQKAFIAAEDKRFYQHHGVDERGLVRAFVANVLSPGRPQGGSTITQQVAKNLLVGSDITYERKIREVIVASQLERTLSKAEILELYLNSIYLGRGSWGVEMAARSYFGKDARQLTVPQAAMLASLAKGPTYYNPDRHVDRTRERYAYVLDRMKEDGYLDAAAAEQAQHAPPDVATEVRERRDIGFHFVDQLSREAKSVANIPSLTGDSYTVHSTLVPDLQRATEAALQDGLAGYEARTGRADFAGPEANLTDAIAKIGAEYAAAAPPPSLPSSPQPVTQTKSEPAWQQALAAAKLPLYDVHWTPAVVLPQGHDKRGQNRLQVGLADGRVLPLSASPRVRNALKLYDVIYTKGTTGTKNRQPQAELRVRPQVEGGALVIENKTGRILAMAGSFSYALSPLNRTTQTQRQPGSAFKPFTYLAALHKGLQPNTLVEDSPITLPPPGQTSAIVRDDDLGRHDWSPKNFDRNDSVGPLTLRQALERSRNLATTHLLQGGIDYSPEQSLAAVCALAREAKIYKECVPYYPFILGAQPVRMIDLAAFYAAISNEGAYRQPYAIESIEKSGQAVYHHAAEPPAWLADGDRAAFYQLKTMLQGVVQRGTAYPLKRFGRYIGGKTGTSEDGNDAWFVGFSNEVTVAVWVGYDNGDGKRRTLGGDQTGAKVAIPIFEPIMEAVWADYTPKTELSPPSPEAKANLIALPIDYATGTILERGSAQGFMEYFRRDAGGQYDDTQYRIVSRDQVDNLREQNYEDREDAQGPFLPWDPRNDRRVYGSWYESDGRRYQSAPPPDINPPRRRGFLDDLFGVFQPPPRESYSPPPSGFYSRPRPPFN